MARPLIFRLFVHINITVQGVLGNAEIIGNFIPGFGDQESTGIVEELDRSNLVLLIHECDRFADQGNRFLDQMIQKIVDAVCDLLWFFFLVDRCDQRVECTFDHGQFGDVIVDTEYIMKASIIISDIGSTAFQDLAIGSFHQITGVIL